MYGNILYTSPMETLWGLLKGLPQKSLPGFFPLAKLAKRTFSTLTRYSPLQRDQVLEVEVLEASELLEDLRNPWPERGKRWRFFRGVFF